jgi:hypothetical protein
MLCVRHVGGPNSTRRPPAVRPQGNKDRVNIVTPLVGTVGKQVRYVRGVVKRFMIAGKSVDAIHVHHNVVPRGTRPEREVVIVSDTSYMAQTEVHTTAETTGHEVRGRRNQRIVPDMTGRHRRRSLSSAGMIAVMINDGNDGNDGGCDGRG